MASENDFGSQLLKIGNPLKLFGKLEFIVGCILLCSAIYLLFKVPVYTQINMWSGWISAIVGIVMLIRSLMIMWKGSFKIFGIAVGRNDPLSLAHNTVNPNEDSSHCFYDAQNIENMLRAQSNPTFLNQELGLKIYYSTTKNQSSFYLFHSVI